MEKTTIQIRVDTLNRLKALKNFERQSYDDVLNVLIDDSDEDVLSDKEIEEIKVALEEVKRGETISIEELAKEYGISLR